MARGFGDLAVMLPLIYAMNQIDFTQEQNILYVRAAFATVTFLTILAWGFVYQRVSSTVNLTKINVPVGQTGFTPSTETEEITITAYDKDQVFKALKQLGIGLVVISLIHFQWSIVQPLFMQCVLTPLQLYKNPIFKIYVLGEKGEVEKRPFVEESPFSALMPTPPAEPQETPQQETLQQEQETDENKQQGKKKKNKNKSNKNE